MVTRSPFTLLKEVADPMLVGLGPNDSVSVEPILGLLGYEEVPGNIQTSKAGEIDLFAFKSQPCIVVGQHRAYKAGNRDMDQGKAYLQFYTEQIYVDEDELMRVEQNGMDSIIARNVQQQRIRNHRYFINRVLKYAINPWEGATTDTSYNKNLIGMFMSSDGGSISDPSDLNATAGTPIDMTTTVALKGSNQTLYNVERIMADVEAGFAKVDYNTQDAFPWSKMYMGTHPNTYAILKTVKDLWNSTTGQKSQFTYLQEFEAMGITVVKSAHFYSSSAVSEDGEGRLFFFTDPEINFLMMEKKASGDQWSEWYRGERPTEEEGVMKLSYETHRSTEIGFRAQAYHFWTAAATESYFKALFVVRVTNYNNAG